MMKFDDLVKYDKKSMFKVFDQWPQIAKDSFNNEISKVQLDKVNHIVFAGMGGSGTIGDIFSAIFSKTDLHIDVIKGYNLPKTVNENTLIVTTSVSGDTVETLNILHQAHEKKCNSVSFSSGGKIKEFCTKNNLSYYNIIQQHSPRASLTSFLYSMLNSLELILPLDNNQIGDSIETLKTLQSKIGSHNLSETNPSLELAEWIRGTPLVYYPWGLQAAAVRFKNSLQENAKMHVIVEDIVESCHNGIVAWMNKSEVNPILIEGSDDFIKTKERWNAVKEFLNLNHIEYYEIKSIEGNILSKIINLIYLLDYSSIYKAILSETDPSPIEPIDFIKKRST